MLLNVDWITLDLLKYIVYNKLLAAKLVKNSLCCICQMSNANFSHCVRNTDDPSQYTKKKEITFHCLIVRPICPIAATRIKKKNENTTLFSALLGAPPRTVFAKTVLLSFSRQFEVSELYSIPLFLYVLCLCISHRQKGWFPYSFISISSVSDWVSVLGLGIRKLCCHWYNFLK